MAACGSLQHIFEKPLPENPTLLESLSSWNHHIKSSEPIEDSSFTEIFGELHFKENPESSSPSLTYLNSQSRPKTDNNTKNPSDYFSSSHGKQYNHNNSESFSSMNSESLQLCTEGLGFESSDDVEDLKTSDWENQEKRIRLIEKNPTENIELKKTRTSGSGFPPPISCIGESGKPCVCFKSYREDGRFVLKEIRIPTQEFLHASREDGRLKLQFFKSDDEIVGEDEDEDEDEEEEVDEFDDDHESDEFDGEVDDAEISNSDGGDHW
ncbi:unnamed protein product [Camellia sinensis]